MTRILIRCDASSLMGSGHVIRCRTLARELRRRGSEVLFLCRQQRGDLIALLEQEFRVLALPEQALAVCEELEGRELYQAWLGCCHQQDAEECLAVLASAGIHSADWLVVDHYGLDAVWQSQLIAGLEDKAAAKLLVIDDLADRPHQADLLLDQNFFGAATKQRYQKLVPADCRQLLGPHYALLGPEYAQLHQLIPPRTELRRVLVFFGGVDQDNLTGRALEALMDPALAHLSVDVVVGRQSPHRKVLAELVAQRLFTTLHDSLPSLAGLIARADLAIGAGGATTWERACLGLPSLVVAIATNQLPFARALDVAGHLQLLGEADMVSAEQICSAVKSRLHEPMVGTGASALTDGWGVSRLATAMLGAEGSLKLRLANASDEMLLLHWANDSKVRANSFKSDPITSDNHHHWFHQGLENSSRLLFIAMAENGCPLGQIRFDKHIICDESGCDEARIDFSLDRCARGFGLAVNLLHLGLQSMVQRWGEKVDAVAEVFTDNIASNACFDRAGFKSEFVAKERSLSRSFNRWRRGNSL